MDDSTGRPLTATVLERWRAELRLSKQRLADLSDVSATYVRLIEAGRDEDGRIVVPSAGVIQKLARGLARAESDESAHTDTERRAYSDLMSAAGYLAPLAPSSAPVAESASPADDRSARLSDLPPAHSQPAAATELRFRDNAQESDPGSAHVDAMASSSDTLPAHALAHPESPYPAYADGVPSVSLRDGRLHRHLLPLLDGWERLDPRDQSLLLDLFELVAERRARRTEHN
jgi:transcriptional regulator with XRE-family HTH domain